jgi:hypothetical protein
MYTTNHVRPFSDQFHIIQISWLFLDMMINSGVLASFHLSNESLKGAILTNCALQLTNMHG